MPGFRVGKPRVRLTRTTNWAAAGAAEQPIPWEIAEFEDPSGVWSISTPTDYPITKTGLYLVVGQVMRTSSSGGVATIRLRVNGTARAATTINVNTTGTQIFNLSMVDELVAADVVDMSIQQSASTPTVFATFSFLAVTRIGPERWT